MKSRKKSKDTLKGNEDATFQNLWDTEIAILRRKFTALQAYLKR